MKGNITISKKSALLLSGALSMFALADFVTIVDSKSSGGIVVSGLTEADKKEILLDSMPIGSVTFRMDSINPATIYGGTWSRIDGDASVAFGDGNEMSGNVVGANDEVVELPAHSHDRGTMDIRATYGGHYGGFYYGPFADSTDWSGAFKPKRIRGTKTSSLEQIDGDGVNSGSGIDFAASRNWTGRTSVEGESSAKMNIRSARIELNVWQRIN